MLVPCVRYVVVVSDLVGVTGPFKAAGTTADFSWTAPVTPHLGRTDRWRTRKSDFGMEDRLIEAVPITVAKRSPSRDCFFDNAKAILILLVIAVHLQLSLDTGPIPVVAQLEPVLFLIVMPGFSFISGHLTPPTLTEKRARRLVMTVVLLVFNSLYTLET